jgi:hypothetical protein
MSHKNQKHTSTYLKAIIAALLITPVLSTIASASNPIPVINQSAKLTEPDSPSPVTDEGNRYSGITFPVVINQSAKLTEPDSPSPVTDEGNRYSGITFSTK